MSQASQLVTFKPDGTDPRWLGQSGFVSGLTYSFSVPGGCDQLTATLGRSVRWRSDAINPGRLISAVRGGTVVWAGILNEPVPGEDGWELTAQGAGSYGDDYVAIYSVAWGTGVFNDCIDQAITRGLPWVRTQDIGAVANIWTGQKVDKAGQSISDLLDLGCHKGGLTWTVTTAAGRHTVTVYALPTAANRILVSGQAEARSIAEGPSTLYMRYQSSGDNTATNTAAVNSLTSVTNAADETAHGRREDVMDITSAGTYTSGQAQAAGNLVLKRFQRAAFADPFTVQPGELLNPGGQPLDLGVYWADGITAMVCELWLADFAYGGEVSGGPTNVLIGHYEYHQDDGTAVLTPFENARHDFASLAGIVADTLPVRHRAHKKHRKRKHFHPHVPHHRHGGHPFHPHLH